MKKYILLAIALTITVLAGGEDISRMIKATPLNDTYTSDGICLFSFNTAQDRSNSDEREFGPVSTGTQYFSDGTTNALYRTSVYDWLYICNLSSSFSLTVALNAGYKPDATYSETTPTLSSSVFMFKLNAYGTSPYYVVLDSLRDNPLFLGGVRNVGLLPTLTDTDYATSATFRSSWLTSSTVHVVGR